MTTSSLARMEDWRRGMDVRRFHTFPTAGPAQTVGHHSCGVALVVLYCHPNPTLELLRVCLTHDLSEGRLGDLPATTKWMSHRLGDIWQLLERDEDERLGLKFPTLDRSDQASFMLADNLEGLLYCREQARMGNLHFRIVAENWANHLYDMDCWDLAPIGFRMLFIDLWNELYPERPLQLVEAPGVPGLS